ncbi:hypothetical protein FB451DRAFT_1360344 [Mycena latifolia]|nr:hypothetical protein FB451DRAFT_1360344 [Mycena latifolia]
MVHAEFHQLKEKTMLRHYVQWCKRPLTAFDTFSDGLRHLRHLQYLAKWIPILEANTIFCILQVHFSEQVDLQQWVLQCKYQTGSRLEASDSLGDFLNRFQRAGPLPMVYVCGAAISNWGWWRPPMQPLTYREASQAIQLSHQMNLPVWIVEASDTAFMGWEASQAVQLSHQMNSPGIYLATSEASDASGRLPSNKFQTGKLKASDTSGINYEPSKEQASKAISRRQYMVPKEPDWRLEEAMM